MNLTEFCISESVSLVVLVALFGIAAAAIATDPMCIGKGDPEFFRKPGSCSEVYLCHKVYILTLIHLSLFNFELVDY